MKILVTGAAGFIGMHVTERLLKENHRVTGVDNFNPYYDVELKRRRAQQLEKHPGFKVAELDLVDQKTTAQLFEAEQFTHVIHLAAQPGVRYSLINPHAYAQNNVVAFVNVLEACRRHNIAHLVYASTSSVYGANNRLPYAESDNVDHPVSLYAATKKANELMAHSYSHLFDLPTTGLRFFTVYGPWGRPDNASILFTRAILADEPIRVFNYGKMQRDFTYIDDIVEGVWQVLNSIPRPCALSGAPYAIYNIGHNQAVNLEEFIAELESALGKKSYKDYQPLQPGDVLATYADIDALHRLTGYRPQTSLREGIARFVAWYRKYYHA